MSLYKEIIGWSRNKSVFIQDAIRRLLFKSNLDESDIDELILLLKKEIGFIGISLDAVLAKDTDIPIQTSQINQNTRILSIEKPININALFNNAKLGFEKDGLSLVFGSNGSGKSSYARVLKKLCWSRHKQIDLKPNVYTGDTTEQSVKIIFENGQLHETFQWKAGIDTHPALNSIFIFDSNCASIYLNNENPTEYKPVGIDILEKLIHLCGDIDAKLNAEISMFITAKPQLETIKYGKTELYKWYSQIENIQKEEIEEKLKFTEDQTKRKNELTINLRNSNPLEANKNLQQKIVRYSTVKTNIQAIEQNFAEGNKSVVESIKQDLITKKEAYQVAQKTVKGDDPLKGVGSETWRQLWDAAKRYAIQEVHPNTFNFPDSESAEICVFCQQPLSKDARERLFRFNTFIQDETSKDFVIAEEKLKNKIDELEKISIIVTDTLDELKMELPNLVNDLLEFQTILSEKKLIYINFLNSNTLREISDELLFPTISNSVNTRIGEIQKLIDSNINLIENRTLLEKELLELEALEFLFQNKAKVLKYSDEYVYKYWLNQCKTKTNTRIFSLKIGEILESRAIELQHDEFIRHLTALNPLIASKVSIKKTRTSNGETFQRCGFTNLNEQLPNILSEGEQKVVALANFLSECTIDFATNTIIFDDPVNSLDQDYREAIAKKIVELSSNRQIIVLTHDLYFLRLLMDIHKSKIGNDCLVIGLMEHKGFSGIPSDEIPYLAKNVQQRIDTIRVDLTEINSFDVSQASKIESVLERMRQRMRKLLERAVEEVLTNHTIQRFSKNLNLKQSNLANIAVAEKADIEFVLNLFGKYSVTEHDGSIETIPIQPNEDEIENDLKLFSDWKDQFNSRVKVFKQANGYK